MREMGARPRSATSESALAKRKVPGGDVDEAVSGMRSRTEIEIAEPLSVHDGSEVGTEKFPNDQMRHHGDDLAVARCENEVDWETSCLRAPETITITCASECAAEIATKETNGDG
jgi:hypothetical protein